MHPYETVILVTLALLLIFLLWIQYENYKQRKRIRRKVQRIYGNVPEREYSPGDIENISHYFRRKENQGFYIDDITWNDLDMDRIYMLINQTVSSPGEDVLYDMLRRPLFNKEDIEKREEKENKAKKRRKSTVLVPLSLLRLPVRLL